MVLRHDSKTNRKRKPQSTWCGFLFEIMWSNDNLIYVENTEDISHHNMNRHCVVSCWPTKNVHAFNMFTDFDFSLRVNAPALETDAIHIKGKKVTMCMTSSMKCSNLVMDGIYCTVSCRWSDHERALAGALTHGCYHFKSKSAHNSLSPTHNVWLT